MTALCFLSLGMCVVASTCAEAMALFFQSTLEEQMEVGSAAGLSVLQYYTVFTMRAPVLYALFNEVGWVFVHKTTVFYF